MFGIHIDRNSSQSLTVQVSASLRSAVRSGLLKSGDRLPPSRRLAEELGVSRAIIMLAYEQLVSEGYFESRKGSGTFITEGLKRLPASVPLPTEAKKTKPMEPAYDFRAGIPDLRRLPVGRWHECVSDVMKRGLNSYWSYGECSGEPALKRAIGESLFRIRGISTSPDSIVITRGTAESLSLLASFFPRKAFYSEFPSIPYASRIFRHHGWQIKPLEQDLHGALVPGGTEPGSLFYLTPSHQFPTGIFMPLKRRIAFLGAIEDGQSYILEDDYDSEFRFRGVPAEPLMALHPEGVFYLGTFSKCMFPALRLGFMIVPGPLKADFSAFKNEIFSQPPLLSQLALARFIDRGYLEQHLFSMKRIYRKRMNTLVSELERNFKGLHISGADCGFHLCVRFRERSFHQDFFEDCRKQGIGLKGTAHYMGQGEVSTDSLILGYGNIEDETIPEGIEALKQSIDRCAP